MNKDKDLEIFCVTNKHFNFFNDFKYRLAGVGKDRFPSNYISCNKGENIFYKEEYYSELTFHYWFWKNLLNKYSNEQWIGFCQKRRFWLQEKKDPDIKINDKNIKDKFLYTIPYEWKNFDAVVCEPIYLNNPKIMKIFKRGFKNILKDPGVLFDKKKQTIKLHFDMFHGYGNIDLAISVMHKKDKEEFKKFIHTSILYNPHIVFISKPKIINKWFYDLFGWLDNCEKIFGFDQLKGYDTKRLYAYLAERYLSFWFKKYTKSIDWPLITLDLKKH